MKKYIIGFAVGAVSYAALQHLAFTQESSVQSTGLQMRPPVTGQAGSHDYIALFSSVVINPLFETERPTTDMLEPFKNDSFPVITLDTITPLRSFSRDDIQSVCLARIDKEQTFHSFTVNIFLKPDARRTLGKTLIGRGGQEHEFRVLGYSVNNFFVDEEKASYLLNHSDTYPLYPYNKALDVTDDNTFLLDHPDISIVVDRHAITDGLTMAKYASGTNDLKPCTPQDMVSYIPGYADHLIYWKNLQEKGYFPYQ